MSYFFAEVRAARKIDPEKGHYVDLTLSIDAPTLYAAVDAFRYFTTGFNAANGPLEMRISEVVGVKPRAKVAINIADSSCERDVSEAVRILG